jgi:hypothetical protein
MTMETPISLPYWLMLNSHEKTRRTFPEGDSLVATCDPASPASLAQVLAWLGSPTTNLWLVIEDYDN